MASPFRLRSTRGFRRRSRFTMMSSGVHASKIRASPSSPTRRHVRILYAAQTGVAPPTFVFFTNVATSFHFSYQRFLENRLREEFGFEGTPLRMHVRPRRKAGAETA